MSVMRTAQGADEEGVLDMDATEDDCMSLKI